MLERFILRRGRSTSLDTEEVASLLHAHNVQILDSGSTYHFIALDPSQSAELAASIRGWTVTRATATPRPDTRQKIERRVVEKI